VKTGYFNKSEILASIPCSPLSTPISIADLVPRRPTGASRCVNLATRGLKPVVVILAILGVGGGWYWASKQFAARKAVAQHRQQVQRMVERSNALERIAVRYGARVANLYWNGATRYATTADFRLR